MTSCAELFQFLVEERVHISTIKNEAIHRHMQLPIGDLSLTVINTPNRLEETNESIDYLCAFFAAQLLGVVIPEAPAPPSSPRGDIVLLAPGSRIARQILVRTLTFVNMLIHVNPDLGRVSSCNENSHLVVTLPGDARKTLIGISMHRVAFELRAVGTKDDLLVLFNSSLLNPFIKTEVISLAFSSASPVIAVTYGEDDTVSAIAGALSTLAPERLINVEFPVNMEISR